MFRIFSYIVCLIIMFSSVTLSQNLKENDSTIILDSLDVNLSDSADALASEYVRIVDTNIIIPTLDFSGVSLQDAFTALIRAYKLSVYIDSSVTGSISMRLENVSLNDALLFIMKEYNLEWERTGDIVKVYRPKIAPPPPPPLEIKYDGTNISFNLQNADLKRFVDEVINQTGNNIIIDDNARGNITGQLVNIGFEKGMKAILSSNGFSFGKIDGIYHIGRIGQTGDGGKSVSRYSVFCQDDLVTIDVRNAPIADILTTLSDECHLSIIVHGKIEGTISASYKDKPLSDVLGYILRGTQYSFKTDGDIYFVGNKTAEDLYDSKLVKLKHISNITVPDLIPATLSKQVTIKPVNEQNGLIITGPSTLILEIESFIKKIDIPPAQVLFEAIVVDYNLTKGKKFDLYADNTGLSQEALPTQVYYPNIDYSSTGDNLQKHLEDFADLLNISNIGTLSSDFFMRLQFMVEEGVANIQSRPQIAALNGHTASIEIGTSQYYLLESSTIYPSQQTSVSTQTSQRFEIIEADMSLEVTPWVTESGEIIVEIKPQFNAPAAQFDPEVPPTINRRIFKSTVRLRDGETIVLGGMIQDQKNATIKKFPILGDLPLLGQLFRSTDITDSKVELMVYLTPHIYYGSEGSVDIEKILNEKK